MPLVVEAPPEAPAFLAPEAPPAPAPVAPPEPTVEDILLRAAAIVRRGWCQWLLWDNEGNYCAVGAIMRAVEPRTGHEWGRPGEVASLVHRVGRLIDPRAPAAESGVPVDGTTWRALVDFNNAFRRTAEEVAQLIETAALAARKD